MRRLIFVVAASLSAAGAAAQNLESVLRKVPPSMAQDLDTLRHYADEVSRRSGGKTDRSARATDNTPQTGTPLRQDSAATPERDPFEVSPRLREVSPRSLTTGAGGSRISRAWRLKALVSAGPLNRIAQIAGVEDDPRMEAMTVRENDEVDFEGQRYMVKVHPDRVELIGKGAPQLKVIVR